MGHFLFSFFLFPFFSSSSSFPVLFSRFTRLFKQESRPPPGPSRPSPLEKESPNRSSPAEDPTNQEETLTHGIVKSAASIYILTPQRPLPPTTPSQSPIPPPAVLLLLGLQLMLLTSYSHLHEATGVFSCVTPVPFDPPGWDDVVLFTKSQMSTRLSSAPPAIIPLLVGFHSIQLTLLLWPLSSTRAWPGWRTSRIRTRLESCENVAMRWAS